MTLEGQPRRETASTYFVVRALHRDVAEWSHEEPERWAIWVAPTPMPRTVVRTVSKQGKQVQFRMQQRTRSLTPILPAFMRSATALRDRGHRLLEPSLATAHGESFTIDGVTYRRHDPPVRVIANTRARVWAEVVAAEKGAASPVAVGKRADITRVEADGFWGWAVASTLKEDRHQSRRAAGADPAVPASLRCPHDQHHRAPAPHCSLEDGPGTTDSDVAGTGQNPRRSSAPCPRNLTDGAVVCPVRPFREDLR
ncbi:hypothetical protein RKD54_001375 [Pseudarthrobacter sp. SLBN-100]